MASDSKDCFYRWKNTTLLLFCYIQPLSSSDQFAGLYSDRVKIRITAPPVDGQANRHLIQYIAKQFDVKKSAVTIARGKSGRQKNLHINAPKKIPSEWGIARP